ncbi:TPA: hypothetical protein H1011_03465 [archaeon]|jgi:uncharacterized coiled-coil protein SlyX|uniref:Uncharacterized protein n=1 Tax=Candidatus Undinarchaeum marinum TaxID=2756141 RepID=A0A832V2K3_9ARCH|nr:hypothetical protein [Candidatus Undinarchaeum marinum]
MFWTKDPREKVRTILMNMYGAVTSKTPWGAPLWKKYDRNTKKLRRLIEKESSVRAMRFDIDEEKMSLEAILNRLDRMEPTQFREMSKIIYKTTRSLS